jgi:hypothetical protein
VTPFTCATVSAGIALALGVFCAIHTIPGGALFFGFYAGASAMAALVIGTKDNAP